MAVTYKSIEDAYRKKDAAIDEVVAAATEAYKAQKEDARSDTTDALQQIYLQKERDAAALRQQNKAAGVTGGAAESAAVALEANYGTNRTNALLDRDRTLSELAIQQRQEQAQGEVEKANNAVALETGRLSFEQDERDFTADEQAQRRSELWELVRAGTITQSIADELGWSVDTLRSVYNSYQ